MKIDERTPLSWPEGWPRIPLNQRQRASFGDHTLASAIDFVCDELKRLKCESATITASAFLRGTPTDTGVAVYFVYKGQRKVLACDKWDRIAHNFWAIGKHIEALRGQQRWGVGNLDQAFAGYTAIPEKTGGSAWHELLGVPQHATEEQIRAAWREKSKIFHPDKGGSNEQMSLINGALEAGLRQIGERRAA